MIGKNNPFNIRYNSRNKWLGLDGHTRGFCNFTSLKLGVRAAAYIVIRSYSKSGIVTPRSIISRFAPASENDVDAYLSFVCREGLTADAPLVHHLHYVRLLRRMSLFEGNPVSSQLISDVITLYKLRPYA